AGGALRPLLVAVAALVAGLQVLEVELDRLRLPERPLVRGAVLRQHRLVLAEDALGGRPLRLERRDRGEDCEDPDRHCDPGRDGRASRLPRLRELVRLQCLASHGGPGERTRGPRPTGGTTRRGGPPPPPRPRRRRGPRRPGRRAPPLRTPRGV